MNEVFYFKKELNIKKIILVIIVIILILGILLKIFNHNDNSTKEIKTEVQTQKSNPNSTFYDINQQISITLPNSYRLLQYSSKNNYLIELRSENNLNIFISKENILSNKTLSEIASADIKSYIENFNNYSNLSEPKGFKVGSKQAYTYSFHYLDSKTKQIYYLQVIWLQTDSEYFIFDIEFPLDDLNNYTALIDTVLNSLTIY